MTILGRQTFFTLRTTPLGYERLLALEMTLASQILGNIGIDDFIPCWQRFWESNL